MSLASSRSPKRRRRNDERCSRCDRKKHLYLALDDWSGGYSVHKLDPDDMPEHLSEPPAVRVTGPDWGSMSFAAFGGNLPSHRHQPILGRGESQGAADAHLQHGDVRSHCRPAAPRRPRLQPGRRRGRRWEAVRHVVAHRHRRSLGSERSMVVAQHGSSAIGAEGGDHRVQRAAPRRSYHLHVHRSKRTYSFDTGNGECRVLGDWVLPFTGQAHYDAEFDAWVGLHAVEHGCVCLCQVPSRSSGARQAPECTMLMEKLCRYDDDAKRHDRTDGWWGIKGTTTLTYIGDSRYCLVEHVPCGEHYGSKGELRTKVHRTTRSYAVSKTQVRRFSHAICCM
ncbi:hypothetical protein BDA96_07G086200 [Sorghum bicolor]|uniref:Uncharacterized protein n=1 Tax=Sorghum bicolor TaxID=4558 RepID=A0A921QIY6_SORBI|nr:hypothetical protein BDA96_07G086200 [Sorghum bicolor]